MTLKLFWVQTIDHCEDWFVVARDLHEAARYHEEMEGYEAGEAVAEEIVAIPETLAAVSGWPSEELLQALGATFKGNGITRIVELGGQTYCEGMLEEAIRSLDDDQNEDQGNGRLNGTSKAFRTRH